MHIPDSIISPSTSAAATVAMLPVWALAARRVRDHLGTRQVPLLALGSAFCFVIMMFNIPALGGTTAHPVAGTLMAVLLGPWAACIGVSVALGIQALFFGDGGLLAFGANCFAMAFALPFVGYSLYRVLCGNRPANDPLRPLFAGIGAYVALNVAAAIVAVFLGIQPALFREPNGQAIYFPFGLKITLPAMLLTHLLVAGPAEAVVTALALRYLQTLRIPFYQEDVPKEARLNPEDRKPRTPEHRSAATSPRYEPLWIGLLALVALTPLGLLATGDAWGEWDAEGLKAEIQKVEGKEYVPRAVAEAEEIGYTGIRGLEDYASERGGWAYIGAGALGVGAIVLLLLTSGRLLARRDTDDPPNNGGKGVQTEALLSPENRDTRTPEAPTPAPRNPSAETLPEWLRRPSEETAPEPETRGRPPNPYIQRALAEMAAASATVLATERWARQPGYLQRLDARAKLIGFLALILVTALLRRPGPLLALYTLALVLALASRLPLGMLLKRVWLSVPLFVGALALPAALNIVTPGPAVLTFWSHPLVALTAPGLLTAGTLTLRVGVAVTLAALLALTTGGNDLLQAARALFVPRQIVLMMALTYRYLLLLLQTAAEMFLARRSRTVGRTTNAQGRQFVGSSIGALFGKTLALAEEVHAAMLSRGFTGEIRTLARRRWGAADTAWLLAVCLTAMLALNSPRLLP